MLNMIPKVIHYCWFGGNPLPEDAKKCIASWKKYLPDYEIKEWNESNFDVNCCPYVKEAYEAKKYAFVSDYARFHVLYQEGGLYFDTDVEVIKNMDCIIAAGNFMGFEKSLATKQQESGATPRTAVLGVAPLSCCFVARLFSNPMKFPAAIIQSIFFITSTSVSKYNPPS